MNHSSIQGALNEYRQVKVQSGIMDASPHRLIQMLMEGALDKINIARGHMSRGNVAEKGKHICWAISILEGLRASLDHQNGGMVAANLDALYEYMSRRLLESNVSNDVAILDETRDLLSEIKTGWDGIAPTQKQQRTGT